MIRIHTFLLTIVLGAASALAASPTEPLTVEWVYGEQGSHVADVPQYAWLNDGTAVLYDTRLPESQRTFEKLDPSTGQRHAVLDMSKAVGSLASLQRIPEVKQALPWPRAFDGAANLAAYEFHGDIFLLDLRSSQFTQVTDTPAEEKDTQFSPDGRFLSYVRENDLYAYDIANKKEIRLTNDGSKTTLNGTLSWVYWEEVFGRQDTGYWWSPDSRSIAYLQTDEAGCSRQHLCRFCSGRTECHSPGIPEGRGTESASASGSCESCGNPHSLDGVTTSPTNGCCDVNGCPTPRASACRC